MIINKNEKMEISYNSNASKSTMCNSSNLVESNISDISSNLSDFSKNSINVSSNVSNEKSINQITTIDYLLKNKSNNSIEITQIEEKPLENPGKKKTYKDKKLFDETLVETKKDLYLPKYYAKIEDNIIFYYLNDLKTYCITASKSIHDKINKDWKYFVRDINDCKYNKDLGIFFCGKTKQIKEKEGIVEKICAPDQFICKECMNYNQKAYGLEKNWLININGRIAKINNSSYHCFGHFLLGEVLYDCITKFSCKACELLNEYKDYYET